jgi:hypothetical protein
MIMARKSTLSAGLAAAANPEPPAKTAVVSDRTVMIGAQFSPEVRRALLLIQAEPENDGKNMKDLLGEAINDLCVKYRKPQPYKQKD